MIVAIPCVFTGILLPHHLDYAAKLEERDLGVVLFPQKIVGTFFFLFYNAGDKPNPAERTSLPSIYSIYMYFVIFEKARMKLDPRSNQSPIESSSVHSFDSENSRL